MSRSNATFVQEQPPTSPKYTWSDVAGRSSYAKGQALTVLGNYFHDFACLSAKRCELDADHLKIVDGGCADNSGVMPAFHKNLQRIIHTMNSDLPTQYATQAYNSFVNRCQTYTESEYGPKYSQRCATLYQTSSFLEIIS